MLIWVFGGTAVGKKHFIRHSIPARPGFANFEPAWMDDGELPESQRELFCRNNQEYLVRWQWGREHVLADLRDTYSDITQKIILLRVPSKIAFQRAVEREGESPWTRKQLADECRTIRWVAMGIAADYGIPLTEIDYS